MYAGERAWGVTSVTVRPRTRAEDTFSPRDCRLRASSPFAAVPSSTPATASAYRRVVATATCARAHLHHGRPAPSWQCLAQEILIAATHAAIGVWKDYAVLGSGASTSTTQSISPDKGCITSTAATGCEVYQRSIQSCAANMGRLTRTSSSITRPPSALSRFDTSRVPPSATLPGPAVCSAGASVCDGGLHARQRGTQTLSAGWS